MMTLKFSRNVKVTHALTGRRPARSAVMMALKFSQNAKVTRALAGRRSVRSAADDNFYTITVFPIIVKYGLTKASAVKFAFNPNS